MNMTQRRKTVAIIHPDLGIGGAEMLMVNLAMAL
jgi:alpha-1,3/alpha-1,6-mannosyltransferase